MLIRRNYVDGKFVIVSIAEDSLAQGHLLEGDRLVSVNGCEVAGLRSGDVLRMIQSCQYRIVLLVVERLHSSSPSPSAPVTVTVAIPMRRFQDASSLRQSKGVNSEEWFMHLCGELMPCHTSTWLPEPTLGRNVLYDS
jgi:hypothetical protein